MFWATRILGANHHAYHGQCVQHDFVSSAVPVTALPAVMLPLRPQVGDGPLQPKRLGMPQAGSESGGESEDEKQAKKVNTAAKEI